MTRVQRWLLMLATALTGALAAPAVAIAEERDCAGAIGAETVDNLRVPQGAACTLTGTFVKGTVKVERDATLTAEDIEVIGNVQAEGARNVVLRGSRVGGSVQVKQGGAAETTGSQINGDIQYDQQTEALLVSGNTVGGSVQVVGNTGGASITTNTIDGNLQCKENAPPPTGGGNLVHGNAEDQCATFGGGPGAPGAGENGDDGAVTVRRAATRGATVVFRGRAAGAGSGVRVRLQVRGSGSWRSVDADRTDRSGAYRLARRFARGARARTVRVRVLVRRQAGWDSGTATSRVLRVRIAAR
jgi:hypothetical protein